MSRRRFLLGTGAVMAAGPLAVLANASPALADTGGKSWHSPQPASIPVLAYHQLDNTPDVESISSAMFNSNMAYLHGAGFSTIGGSQYVAWLQGQGPRLPAKPILITVDDGIINFFGNGTTILRQYGFRAVAFIVTGFADGAASGNPNNVGWNMTWPQLVALDSRVWEFAFHAGAQGHYLQTYDPNVAYFYDARMPGETDAQFEARVTADVQNGRAELNARLSSKIVDSALWAVPWNDAGQPGQPYDGPPGWLEQWASATFPVVFLQDSDRNGVMHERFRFEVQGWMTESYFEDTLAGFVSSGAFVR